MFNALKKGKTERVTPKMNKRIDNLEDRLVEINTELKSIFRALDRINDTIAEHFEEEEFLGEIKENS